MDRSSHPTADGALEIWSHRGTSGQTLVALHGFSLTGESFELFAESGDLRLLAPDLPGHGRTTVHPVDVPATVRSLAAWMDAATGPSPVLGYSQGGRMALHLAASRPDLVTTLILVSTTPGLDPTMQRERAKRDRARARRIRHIGLEAFLDEWAEDPLVGTRHLDHGRRTWDRIVRSANSADGLAEALVGLGQGATARIDVAGIEPPMLWIAGGDDDRYSAIALDMASSGTGEADIVEGVGHNIVMEAPERLAEVVRRRLWGASAGP